jgi:TonB family protein
MWAEALLIATMAAAPTPAATCTQEHADGVVTLSFTIKLDGSVGNIRVLKSTRSDLSDEAVKAVSRWRYEPQLQDGKPIERKVAGLEILFCLEN